MTAIAIDDEPIALEVIKSLAAKVPFLELKACYTNAMTAMANLQEDRPDLIFLDIKMPDVSGIEWLRAVKDPPLVIFTTAYSEHAVEGFELDAADYLLKPFSLVRFLKAVNKAQELLHLKQLSATGSPNLGDIFLRSGTEQIRVNLADLLYVQSAGNYVQFIFTGSKLLSRLTLNETEGILPSRHFTRIHRSYIVANNRITRADKNSIYIGNITLPVGAGYADKVATLVRPIG